MSERFKLNWRSETNVQVAELTVVCPVCGCELGPKQFVGEPKPRWTHEAAMMVFDHLAQACPQAEREPLEYVGERRLYLLPDGGVLGAVIEDDAPGYTPARAVLELIPAAELLDAAVAHERYAAQVRQMLAESEARGAQHGC